MCVCVCVYVRVLLSMRTHWDNKNGYVTRIIKKRFWSRLYVKKNKQKSKGREFLLKTPVKMRKDNQ